MLLSTRKTPPRHISLPKSSQQHLTVKSFLLNSPLPSPSLPSILPRHGKKPPRLDTRRVLRLICWLGAFATALVIMQRASTGTSRAQPLHPETTRPHKQKHVGAETIPDGASPVTVFKPKNRKLWTISIPNTTDRPLTSLEYDSICLNIDDVAHHTASIKDSYKIPNHLQFHEKDPNYIEIADAQMEGLLPKSHSSSQTYGEMPVCERSLTYVLDASGAGLGETLLGLWMSYGLAQHDRRTFLIDDSQFTYGRLARYFATKLPKPDCRPPPWDQRTSCPHYARHLVVTSQTLHHTFGKSFHERFDIRKIYKMARAGYEALFKLRADDEDFVKTRLAEIRNSVSDEGALVGIHVRRGDRHPFEFQYQHAYLPLSKYVSAAQEVVPRDGNSTIIFASDDADLHNQPEMLGISPAQQRMKLADRQQLKRGGLGWEGGFFSDSFWSVGLPEEEKKKKHLSGPKASKGQHSVLTDHNHDRSSQSPHLAARDYRSNPTSTALQLREFIGRSYLLDLAVLADSDEVVCGVSSKTCRLLGVMIGWDKFRKGKWRNIDGEYGWNVLF